MIHYQNELCPNGETFSPLEYSHGYVCFCQEHYLHPDGTKDLEKSQFARERAARFLCPLNDLLDTRQKREQVLKHSTSKKAQERARAEILQIDKAIEALHHTRKQEDHADSHNIDVARKLSQAKHSMMAVSRFTGTEEEKAWAEASLIDPWGKTSLEINADKSKIRIAEKKGQVVTSPWAFEKVSFVEDAWRTLRLEQETEKRVAERDALKAQQRREEEAAVEAFEKIRITVGLPNEHNVRFTPKKYPRREEPTGSDRRPNPTKSTGTAEGQAAWERMMKAEFQAFKDDPANAEWLENARGKTTLTQEMWEAPEEPELDKNKRKGR